MIYSKDEVSAKWEEIKKKNDFKEEEYAGMLAKTLLNFWLTQPPSEMYFFLAGPYWEVLHPLLQREEPRLLSQYASHVQEEFDIFDKRVKELVDLGADHLNMLAAVEHINWTYTYYIGKPEFYELELPDDEYVYYRPNRFPEE